VNKLYAERQPPRIVQLFTPGYDHEPDGPVVIDLRRVGADDGAVGAFHSVDEAVARPAGGAFQKAGIKELVIEPWFGVFVPGGTPAARKPKPSFCKSTAETIARISPDTAIVRHEK
jgi:hypothetical protein